MLVTANNSLPEDEMSAPEDHRRQRRRHSDRSRGRDKRRESQHTSPRTHESRFSASQLSPLDSLPPLELYSRKGHSHNSRQLDSGVYGNPEMWTGRRSGDRGTYTFQAPDSESTA